MIMHEVRLDQDTENMLLKEVNGQGGFQSLLGKLQSQYDKENKILKYDDNDLERLENYSNGYGAGGFESRLIPILLSIIKGKDSK